MPVQDTLNYLYQDFIERDLPAHFQRDMDMEPVPGKALALIGMRRVGKTYLCYQKMQSLLDAGIPKHRLLYLNFEDDRLFNFQLADCQSILDVFYGNSPSNYDHHCYFFFDEIQNVPHWERFIRRLIDTEKLSVYVTGSSAKLLSAEISTSLRGRSLDREVFPFSFSEYLRTKQIAVPKKAISNKSRQLLEHHARDYCRFGGLPEVLGREPKPRTEILQSYVDAVILRDVVERHGISNTAVLRALVNRTLSNPSTQLSISKFHSDLKSQGHRIGKDDLYAYLQHLTEAYLLFQVPLWTRSENKRRVNPSKVYAIDNGILDTYRTHQTTDHGAFLENLVYLTLRRSGIHPGYGKTVKGREIDFVYPNGETTVYLQVCWQMEDPATRERELRPLREIGENLSNVRREVITFNESSTTDDGITIRPLWEFLLNQ